MVGQGWLRSAGLDYFDDALLSSAIVTPRRVAVVVGMALCHDRAYFQVADRTLIERLSDLVEQGKLKADGDPRALNSTSVWLPH